MPIHKYPKGYIPTYKRESGTKVGFYDEINKACDAINSKPKKFLSKKEIEGPTEFADLIQQFLSQGGKVKKYQEGYAEDSTIQSKYALEDRCAVSSAGKLRIDPQVF
jgi:hypothetical protein